MSGYIIQLKKDELQYLEEHGLDFSVTSKELWLGLGAYVNHSCSSNTKTYCNKIGGEICLQAITDINKGEEITWNYGPDYFEIGECKCPPCTNKVGAI